MTLADEGRYDVRRVQIEIVMRTIQVCRHGGNEVGPVLIPVGWQDKSPAILAIA